MSGRDPAVPCALCGVEYGGLDNAPCSCPEAVGTPPPTVKRKSKVTPTARTLLECRKRGWPACVVEKWIPQTKQRKDAFGFGDLLVLDGKPGSLLIQATGDNGGDVARRIHKIQSECFDNARAWLAAGNRIEVWGWGKRGGAGSRKLWTLRVVSIDELAVRWETP